MNYVPRWGNPHVPEMFVMIAPYMDELLRLRKAHEALRWEKYTPNPLITSILEDTPFRVKQDDDGKWSCSFMLAKNYNTGVSGQNTAEDALKAALNHLVDVWATRERDLRERWGIEADDDD